MDNLERRESSQELSQWVTACSGLLAPPAGWEPDLNTALARFEARAYDRWRWRRGLKRYLLAGAMAALLACIAMPIIPQTRAFAQQAGNGGWRRLEQLWYWVTLVQRPSVLGSLPVAVKALHIRQVANGGSPLPVSSAADAAARAGFIPRLLDSSILSGSPRLSVLGPMSFVAVISAADLAEALRAEVPQQWDGANLTLLIGATVTAAWPPVSDGGTAWSELNLAQGPAPVVTAPAGFDLEAFATAALQAAGMRNRDRARRLAQQPTTAPALLSGYATPYHFVGVREVSLRNGSATLIEEFGLAGPEAGFGYSDGMPRIERITLLWSTPDRVYVLSGRPATPPGILSADLAAFLASIIDLANTVD